MAGSPGAAGREEEGGRELHSEGVERRGERKKTRNAQRRRELLLLSVCYLGGAQEEGASRLAGI